MQGRELVSRYLDQKHGFLLLVSHDRAFLDGCVDHILSINRADIQVSKGNFSTWMENRERQDAFEQRQNEKLLREISRLKETAREKSQWAGTAERRKIGNGQEDKEKNFRSFQGAKAERTMARAKAIEKRRDAVIEEKKGLLKNLERREELKLIQLPFYTQRLAELREISFYDGRTVCKGFSLSASGGRADRPARPERLRQEQHPEAPVQTGDPAHRRGLAGQRPSHILCWTECRSALRQRNGLYSGKGNR